MPRCGLVGPWTRWVFFGVSVDPLRNHSMHGPNSRVPLNATLYACPLIGFSARVRHHTTHPTFPRYRHKDTPLPLSTSRTQPLSLKLPSLKISTTLRSSKQQHVTAITERHVVSEPAADSSPVCEELHGAQEQPHACWRLPGSAGGDDPSGLAHVATRL